MTFCVCACVCHTLVSDNSAWGKENNRTIVADRVTRRLGFQGSSLAINNFKQQRRRETPGPGSGPVRARYFVLTQLYLRSDPAAVRDCARTKTAKPRHLKEPRIVSTGFSY